MRWGGCQRFVDLLQHSKTVFRHFVVPEAQYVVAFLLQKRISLLVVAIFHVLAAVQLYQLSPGQTGEVRNVGANGLLSTKFVTAQLPVAQEVPE